MAEESSPQQEREENEQIESEAPEAMSPGEAPEPELEQAPPGADGQAAEKPDKKKRARDKAPKAKKAKAVGVREELEEIRRVGAFHIWLRDAVRQTPSWLVSMIFHMVVLIGLALWSLPSGTIEELRQLVIAPNQEDMEDLEELEDESLEDIDLNVTSTEVIQVETEVEPEDPNISPAEEMEAAAVKVELSDFGLEKAPRNDLLATVGAYSGSALSGRGKAARAAMVARHGGSAGSEKAVAAALEWLARVQCPDGGWSFNHTLAPGGNQSRNPGSLTKARNGATGMALLPFLGAGQTHKKGKYKKTVKAGLYYLVNHMKVDKKGGSWHEGGGSMYSHGLASIVICEAYAMTKDKGLYAPAQQAINFICYAQDPVGGGWRYAPRQPGDTSVVGWQIMALKSGHMAYLQIPPIVVKKSFKYLDAVQQGSGAYYGYTTPGKGQATTAIGLLCRMYLGWKKDNPALLRGAKYISKSGPSKTNMYYDYYATQVMRHMEGDMWNKWNAGMRDYLVKTQATKGHEKGSWFFTGGHAVDKGGRLYCTAMATMILEVYYRHLPIYRKQSTEEDFPLE